ncbi:MAG: hypothetical protein HYU41_11815 [Candidatus Rokubacteria bacterium]|nr:hypothetical protein [Candidatus Rokubacteria bacterium]
MTRRRLSWLLLLLALAGCVKPARTVIDVPVERGEPVAVTAKSDDETVLRAVATVLVTRLGVPLRAPVRVHVYPSLATFEIGLVKDGYVNESVAREQAAFATGVGTAHGILLRGDRLEAAPLAVRVGVMAHELTHVSQYELAAGRRSTSDQWLREGFAEWVKFRTIDAMGLRPYAPSRAAVARAVHQEFRPGRFPELATLADSREWIAARQRHGTIATYGQAFVAADRLLERAGRDTGVAYFARFAVSRDRERNFADAFGVSRADFFKEFRRHLATPAR